ncbi:MAG: site-2 protease family protein [Oscillospiraceae bacterium]|nr:site-2 protease family protein [Oscillospiraceae bacterium]MDY4191431.1 site-2 protease family protein [Oscillospiraceae bacterium]
MNIAITILLTVLMFGLLIFFHEFGHFITAKLSGVRVNEFALGMGPVIFRFGRGETQYAIRLFPIGGFVSMEGEDEESDAAGSFSTVSVWKKIWIVTAGAVMNLLLGFVVLIILTASQSAIGSTTVAVFDGQATSSSLLQVGDVIKKMNGVSTHIDNDIVFAMLRDSDGAIDMVVERDGIPVTLKAVPFRTETSEDGITTTVLDFKVLAREKNVGSVLHQSFFMTGSVARMVWSSLIDIITGKFGLNQLSGPVGVATAVGQASSLGFRSMLLLVAFITINLGVFNLLPLPALDGGRLLFLIIEAVRGKPVNPRYEGYVHAIGFLLLIGLMIFVTASDIVKLFQ